MKILSMTATFGKLEHETLTLKPGLNIIEAPNEWGKSTWCAFILAMLYGIDTRQQTTKGTLADKEHYAPWSGRPMSGRMDILWQDRAITLERSTKGRIPFGVFSAYETHTGLAVPELTAENCGLTLLGVEKQVFCRCGFIRLTDMPVTQDEALRRRLNALVTTGDDSDAGDVLSAKLTKLKNTCRSNSKNGLLPQAQEQHQALEIQLEHLHALSLKKQQLIRRQTELQQYLQKLHAHQAALRYQSAGEHLRRLADAQAQESALRTQLEELTAQCASLPSREEAARKLEQLNDFSSRQQALYMELQFQPKPPLPPKAPFYWHEADPEEVEEKLADDLEMYRLAEETLVKKPSILWVFGLLLIAAGAAAACFLLVPGLLAVTVGLILTAAGLVLRKKLRSRQDELCALVLALINEYRSKDTADWKALVDRYRAAYDEYNVTLREFRREQRSLEERTAQLEEEAQQLCQGYHPEAVADELKKAVGLWDTLYDCRRQLQQAEGYVRSLQSVAAPVVAPPEEDTLTHSPQDTDALIADTEAQLRHLQQELGRCIGQMDALPGEEALIARLEESSARIRHLNTALAAITLAQETLLSARNELQKRFAPRIAQRAQALFCALTGGRYDRLSLAEDLSVRTAAAEEDNLHTVLWRSDGTIDQLYLALRLAVSEALTPNAPLVLDDALVRFDDARLAAAMDVLAQEATQKQLLLFTCQSRESKALSQ